MDEVGLFHWRVGSPAQVRADLLLEVISPLPGKYQPVRSARRFQDLVMILLERTLL